MKNSTLIYICSGLLVVIALLFVVCEIPSAADAAMTHTFHKPYSWYFKPKEDGTQPIVADNVDFFKNYPVIYIDTPESKKIYITFDAGFENGNNEKILDVLKEKNAPAAFFLTERIYETSPDLIRRMVDEGHIVGNHGKDHKNLSSSVTKETFEAEVMSLETTYKDITGRDMPKYFRPPEGKYSEALLKMASDYGYTTVFWSFAYVDWFEKNQPSRELALSKIKKRTHPGEVAMFHSTSSTNAAILGEVIDYWRECGYTIAPISELAEKMNNMKTAY